VTSQTHRKKPITALFDDPYHKYIQKLLYFAKFWTCGYQNYIYKL